LPIRAPKKVEKRRASKTFRAVEQFVIRTELIRMYAPEHLAVFGNPDETGARTDQHSGATEIASRIVSSCPFYNRKTEQEVDALRKWLTDPARARFPFSDAMLQKLFPNAHFGRFMA
jgi:hypothetical protein